LTYFTLSAVSAFAGFYIDSHKVLKRLSNYREYAALAVTCTLFF